MKNQIAHGHTRDTDDKKVTGKNTNDNKNNKNNDGNNKITNNK